MIVNVEDDVAEAVAEDIGSDSPQEIAESLSLLWTELENPVEMIEDVKPEVRYR